MPIIECTRDFVEAVAKLNLSPPFRFGRVVHKDKNIDRIFIGLCTEDEMKRQTMLVEALILEGGNAVERRIRGLS